MSKSFEEIKQAAFSIRDENAPGANTARRIGQMFIDTADFIKSEIDKLPSGGGGGVPQKSIMLDVTPNLVYADRPTRVTATGTLHNCVGVINLQADKAMTVFTSGSPVSIFTKDFTVNGTDTIRATCEDVGERLEAVTTIQGVSPIFFGQAYNADELSPLQIAPPRATPAGTYTAHIDTDYNFCFMIPSSMGRLDPSKVKWNGFQFPLNYVGVYQYNQVNYDLYESGAFTEPTDVTIKIED